MFLEQGFVKDGTMYASVMRKLEPDDPLDYHIPLLREVPMIYASGDIDGQKHTSSGVFRITLGMPSFNMQCHYTCTSCVGPLATDCLGCSAT